GLWLSLTGEATAGQVTAAALLFLRTIAPITALLLVTDDLQAALAALGRIVGVIDHDPPEHRRAQPQPKNNAPTSFVTVENVHYAYEPDSPVLHNISTQIRP